MIEKIEWGWGLEIDMLTDRSADFWLKAVDERNLKEKKKKKREGREGRRKARKCYKDTEWLGKECKEATKKEICKIEGE